MRTLLPIFIAAACAHSACAQSATFTPIPHLPGGSGNTSAFGISGDGRTIVGWSRMSDEPATPFRAYRWRADIGTQSLGHMGDPDANGMARGVSFDGEVIIGSADGAYRWTESTGMQPLGDCIALGVSNDALTIVGYCASPTGNVAATWTEADEWQTFGSLGTPFDDAFFFAANEDASVLAGQSLVALPDVEAIRWTSAGGMQGLGDVPGGLHYALGLAISADGSTIVGEAIGDTGQDAFLWNDTDKLVNLESFESTITDSNAQDVSEHAERIVGYADTLGAMVWQQNTGMRSLQSILEDEFGIDLSGWQLLSAQAISDDARTIAGHGFNPSGDRQAFSATRPPPCLQDVNNDGAVGSADLAQLIGAWGPNASPIDPADFDNNNTTNSSDLAQLLGAWGPCP